MRTKLLVAIPTLDFVHSAFVESLVKLQKRLSLECVDYEVCIISGTLVYVARDKLACEAINSDYTHVLWLDSDKAVQYNYKTCFLPKAQFGEDIAFCNRARAMGFKIWCEPTVRCGHIGHITVYPEDQEKWRQGLYNHG